MKYLKLSLVLFSILSLSKNGLCQIQGKWDLVENETIQSIRNSQGYQYSDFKTQSLADRLFTLSLDSVFYKFVGDTLYYKDLDTDQVKTIDRRAFWSLSGDTILVKEIDRIYFRRYYLRKVTNDSLWINPIFEDGVISKRSLKFVKMDE